MRKIKYTFLPIENCNMCGADKSHFKKDDSHYDKTEI